jgi:hypothetical protein
LLTENGVIALEGTSIHQEVRLALQPHTIPPLLEIQQGTFPTSEWLHFRASDDALKTFDEVVNWFPTPEICVNLCAYEDSTLLLKWHDPFDEPIYVAPTVSDALITAFCSALGVGPAKPPSHTVE